MKSLQISPEEYAVFKQHFTFDGLRGLRFGQSFCNYFDVRDNLLFITADPAWCDQYILREYVTKPQAKNCNATVSS